jgi:hypothetical protein
MQHLLPAAFHYVGLAQQNGFAAPGSKTKWFWLAQQIFAQEDAEASLTN